MAKKSCAAPFHTAKAAPSCSAPFKKHFESVKQYLCIPPFPRQRRIVVTPSMRALAAGSGGNGLAFSRRGEIADMDVLGSPIDEPHLREMFRSLVVALPTARNVELMKSLMYLLVDYCDLQSLLRRRRVA
jgi:hypothetical protein